MANAAAPSAPTPKAALEPALLEEDEDEDEDEEDVEDESSEVVLEPPTVVV